MKQFDDYTSKKTIIKYLCLLRAKKAKERNEKHLFHLLTNNSTYNYHLNNAKEDNLSREDQDLLRIMPSRRLWKKLSKQTRYTKSQYSNGRQRIDTIQYNYRSLLFTINYYRKKDPSVPFLQALDRFVEEVQRAINDPIYIFEKPSTYPQKKTKKRDATGKPIWVCRPITSYRLKDRVILRVVNKYLSDFLEPAFCDSSYAFRPRQRAKGAVGVSYSHHAAVEKIIEYKKKYKGKRIWVAECDIQKFYDSVNHSIVRKRFKRLVKNCEKSNNSICDPRAVNLFYGYLKSFCFNKDVYKLNEDMTYWEDKKINIANGQYGWVESELKKHHYKKINQSRIGVPQGGALSGLIANIVLNDADMSVKRESSGKHLYLRFCDDMIILNTSKKKCVQTFNAYQDTLGKLKFVFHPPEQVYYSTKKEKKYFWNETKSKSPYEWASQKFPWVGFLGYEVNFDGSVRVRKKSIRQEIQKQNKLKNEIKKRIVTGRRKSNRFVLESFTSKLVGMSVGRIKLWNHSFVKNYMCWAVGFKKVNNNKWLIEQLKALDKNRSIQIGYIRKYLRKNPQEIFKKPNNKKKRKIIYGKPFSYYSQILKQSEPIKPMISGNNINKPVKNTEFMDEPILG